jgi:Bifunctional DNA primase/polymerase, N-terminal
VTAAEASSLTEPPVSLESVHAFRQRAIANGYALIRVRSRSKLPLAREWQHGEGTKALLDVGREALNTGLLVAGLRCIDVDVDHAQLVSEILDQARLHLPAGALQRGRTNSPHLRACIPG